MKHVYWLLENELAGRTGPDTDPGDPGELAAGGIGAILSVNNGDEVEPRALQKAGIRYACVPYSNAAPPEPGDVEICVDALRLSYAFARQAKEAGRAVLVHCAAGKDRTGLFMSYYLCRSAGLGPEAAIAKVREVRPIAMSAEGWDEFGLEVLRQCGL